MSNIAVINVSGSQHLIKPGYKVEVNKLDVESGKSFTPDVLLSTDGDKVLFNEVKLEVKIIEHKRSEKLHIIKFRAKSRYRKRVGHRQELSVLEIVSINDQERTKSERVTTKKVAKSEVEVVEAKPKAAK